MNYHSKMALLGSTIDYAGTFPPAALELNAALQEAAAWRHKGKHPWLMSKMVLPLTDIKKLTSALLFDQGADGSPWLFAALGSVSQSDSSAEFFKTVDWDLRELRRCREKWYDSSCRQSVISYETKLLPAVTAQKNVTSLLDFIAPVLDRVAHLTTHDLKDFFFEIAWEGDWRGAIDLTVEALVEWLEQTEGSRLVPGIKLRTGGAYVPSAQQLAFAISRITSSGLKFKATQGLHHALSHRDPKTGKTQWGFVNLLGAVCLAQGFGPETFGMDRVEACLLEESSSQFNFETDRFCWDAFAMTCDEIESARRSHGTTFGSCSLDEPDQDLLKEFP